MLRSDLQFCSSNVAKNFAVPCHNFDKPDISRPRNGLSAEVYIKKHNSNFISDIRLNAALTRFVGKWNSLTRSVDFALFDNVFNFTIAREVE